MNPTRNDAIKIDATRIVVADPIPQFPAELKALPIWCVWHYEDRDGKQTKVPYQPVALGDENYSAATAQSNNPTTWVSFEAACASVTGQDEFHLGVFADGSHTFIDLDKCIAGGELEAWVPAVLARTNSYAELSPSGTGLHIFVSGAVEAARKKDGCEIYSEARFFTVTGKHLESTPRTINALPVGELEKLWRDIDQKQLRKKPLIVEANGLNLEQLECGESPDGDDSKGDYQYCAILAERGLTDEQIDALFRASGRMREKWDREDYRTRTLKAVRDKVPAKPTINPDEWPSLFHSYDEAMNAPPLTFAIEGFLQEGGITFFGGLPGHGKTLIMLNTAKALLEGNPLFGHKEFKVTKPAKRVLYLIPESGLGPFVHRLKVFRLLEHVKAGRFFFRTLSKERVALDDPRLLKAAEGADVFLDTAVRFMLGEENSASDHREFADVLFNLHRVGARTVVGAHHSPKAFEGKESITLENAFRGSGDVGAMLATAWAIKQTDPVTNRLYIKNVKPRDFEPCQPFEIEGRPTIDHTGAFRMVAEPGMAKVPTTRYQDKPEVINAKLLRQSGKTLAEIAEQLGVAQRTVERWSVKGKLA
jgi:hypothetical protein